MGIRPNLFFGVAITNLQVDDRHVRCDDPRWTLGPTSMNAALDMPLVFPEAEFNALLAQEAKRRQDWDSPIHDRFWQLCSVRDHWFLKRNGQEPQAQTIGDVVIWRWEYYDPHVLFVDILRDQGLYSDDRLYALANLFPDQFGNESKFHELPQIDPANDRSELAIPYRLTHLRGADNVPLSDEEIMDLQARWPDWPRQLRIYERMVADRHNFAGFRDYFRTSYLPLARFICEDQLHMQLAPADYRLGLYFTWS